MKLFHGNRDILLDLMKPTGRKLDLENFDIHKADIQVESNDLIFLWSDEVNDVVALPHVIVLPEKDVTDFLAWANTYLTSFRPVTGFCRVVTPKELPRILHPCPDTSLGAIPDAWLGGILGEALELTVPYFPISRIGLRTCINTFIYSVARGLVTGTTVVDPAEIVDRQAQCFKLSGRKFTQSRLKNYSLAAEVLTCLAGSREPQTSSGRLLVTACRCLAEDGSIDNDLYSKIVKHTDAPQEIAAKRVDRSTSREQRLEELDKFVDTLRDRSSPENPMSQFLMGHAVSELSPGSLEYGPLVVRDFKEWIGSLVWYGICAGLSYTPMIQDALHGLGRRVARELSRVEILTQRPSCDISLEEFELLTGNGKPAPYLLGANPGTLVVEIFPAITVLVRWPPVQTESERTPFVSDNQGQYQLFPENGISAPSASSGMLNTHRLEAQMRELTNKVEKLSDLVSRSLPRTRSKRNTRRKTRPE